MRRRTFPSFIGEVFELSERQDRLERIMRVIGFSPEKPYTLTVNDGTRNRVEIGVINGDYGIKITDNAGNDIILANGTIIADAIKSGTLDCSLITVENLDAGSITTGYLSATRIQGGMLDCSTMTVTSLDAGSITVGTFVSINSRLVAQAIHGDKIQVGTLNADRITAYSITADKIASNAIETDKIAANAVIASKISVSTLSAISANLGTITAGTITGATIRTAASGQRVVIDTANMIKLYDSGGSLAGQIYGSSSIIALVASAIGTEGHILCDDLFLGLANSEGNIHDVNDINGHNDIKLYVSGSGDQIEMYSRAGGGDISIYPYYGDIYKTGSVSFKIPHPEDPDKYLQYVSVESPEIALKMRGIAKLTNGKATVELPHHWDLATEEFLTTIQLTALEDCNGLYAPKDKLNRLSFEVREMQSGNSNAEFSWELTCTRKDKANFNPEPTKDEEVEKAVEATIAEEENLTPEKIEANRQEALQRRQEYDKKFKKAYKRKTGKDYVKVESASKVKKADFRQFKSWYENGGEIPEFIKLAKEAKNGDSKAKKG